MCDQNGFITKLNWIESIPNPLEPQRAGGPLEGQKNITVLNTICIIGRSLFLKLDAGFAMCCPICPHLKSPI